MPELRKDYVLDKYVIIAKERAKRPHEMNVPEVPKTGTCYFCPGNEELTPPEIYRTEHDGDWQIRVFPNKFPAVSGEGHAELATHNNFYTFADAVGYHEVVVETPDHEKHLENLEIRQVAQVIRVYKLRVEALSRKQGIKYVSVFKNKGENAGCSIAHTHSQIIAYNIVPSIIVEKQNQIDALGKCVYCDVIRAEKNSYRRVLEDENILVFTPYASRFPYEVWIYPKRHMTSFSELSPGEINSFAMGLKHCLGRLGTVGAPYNFFFQYGIHFHLELIPRFIKVKWAGFEYSTDTIINPVTPEDAAAFYRNL